MVSIKRYLKGNSSESTLRQVVALLVEKLGECAVEDDPVELETFRGEMSSVHDALTSDLPPENLMILAESAAEVLEKYNKRITRAIGKQEKAYQTIIRLFQDSLVTIAGTNAECALGLGSIGRELEGRIGCRDLPSMKAQLGGVLSGLVEAIGREKNRSKTLIEKLQIEIESFRKPAVNLPHGKVLAAKATFLREDCVAAIREAIDKGTRHYAVVMVVNRVEPISSRFGREAGDWMLSRFHEYFETQLNGSDRLFRWIGPAMVAILERSQPLDQVRGPVRRMLDSPLQKTYESGGRSVLISISAAWSVIAIASTTEATEQQIRAFTGTHGCHDSD